MRGRELCAQGQGLCRAPWKPTPLCWRDRRQSSRVQTTEGASWTMSLLDATGQQDLLTKGDIAHFPPPVFGHSSHQKVRVDANLEPCFLVAPSHSFVVFSRSVVSDSCDPMDCSPPGSSVHAIFQARILEWVAISFFRGSSWPREWTRVSCFAGGFFTTESPGKPRGSHQSIIPFEVFSTLKLFSVHPEEGAVRHTFIPKKH